MGDHDSGASPPVLAVLHEVHGDAKTDPAGSQQHRRAWDGLDVIYKHVHHGKLGVQHERARRKAEKNISKARTSRERYLLFDALGGDAAVAGAGGKELRDPQ